MIISYYKVLPIKVVELLFAKIACNKLSEIPVLLFSQTHIGS